MKQWINSWLGWSAASEFEDVLDEEDLEDVEDFADEVAMGNWTIEGTSKQELERAIKAHTAAMRERGGEKLRVKCRLQKQKIREAAEEEYKATAMAAREEAMNIRDDIRTDMKLILAHSQRASKLRKVKQAVSDNIITGGQTDGIDLQAMASGITETLTNPEHDEQSPELEEALTAVDLQLEGNGTERAYEEIDEKIEEVREEGEDADIDIGIDEDFEDLQEDSEVSSMFHDEV